METFKLETAEGQLYKTYLEKICALSYLFSDSKDAYLYYRAHENIFCRAFNAKNLSRDDCSIDALKDSVGIGLKTFLNGNGASFQKIAEFNKDRKLFSDKEKSNPKELAEIVSNLRNERLQFCIDTFSVSKLVYHCIARQDKKLKIFEEPMEYIDIKKIIVKKVNSSSILFTDGKSEYSFSLSKSTLLKKFFTKESVEVNINILENPYDFLLNCNFENISKIAKEELVNEFIILPLYSDRKKKVEEKSGLNQWNAGGRKRNMNEIYIPIPAFIHKDYPNFFPSKDIKFNLILPDNKILKAKLCQAGSKALMTDPNKDLGEWLLRKVLRLKEGELLTMEILERKGIDSVLISKRDNQNYEIHFKELGTFEKFKENELDKNNEDENNYNVEG